jgi:lysophospholipase L1-like esterase
MLFQKKGMKRVITLSFVMMLFGFTTLQKKRIKIFLAGDSTIADKRSTAYPETGWGMPFKYFWDSSVNVCNHAMNGRSTKTFISERRWDSIMKEGTEGDYVLIQFGHNDENIEKKDRYTPPDSFKINLRKFIHDANAKKMVPILLTPVSRRRFDSTGKAVETHPEYTKLVKEVAATEKVKFIDLDAKSRVLYEEFGIQKSLLLFLILKPGEHPNYPNGKEDGTHFSELGARLVAQLVLTELRVVDPILSERIFMPK